MRNKIILILMALAYFFSIYSTLTVIYIDLDLDKASYIYLASSIVIAFFMPFIKNIDRITKNWINILVIVFYLFSIYLSLMTFYSSPTDKLNFLAGAIFFLSGSLVLGVSFFLKVKIEIINDKLGKAHKIFRYILLFLFVGVFLFSPLYKIIKPVISQPKKLTKKEMTEKVFRMLPQLNKDLPKMLDEFTQLKQVSFEDMKITYHYELIDTNATTKTILSLKKDFNNELCTNIATSTLIENNVSIIYSYEFNNQDESVEIMIDKCL